MAKQYEIVKRAGTTLYYVEKTDGDNEASAKKLNLQGFFYQGLRKGVTIVFKGLPQARNLRIVRANGVEYPLLADVPVDTIPAKSAKAAPVNTKTERAKAAKAVSRRS